VRSNAQDVEFGTESRVRSTFGGSGAEKSTHPEPGSSCEPLLRVVPVDDRVPLAAADQPAIRGNAATPAISSTAASAT
jgi:hypothetical protein